MSRVLLSPALLAIYGFGYYSGWSGHRIAPVIVVVALIGFTVSDWWRARPSKPDGPQFPTDVPIGTTHYDSASGQWYQLEGPVRRTPTIYEVPLGFKGQVMAPNASPIPPDAEGHPEPPPR